MALVVCGVVHLVVRPDRNPTHIAVLGATIRLPSTSLALIGAGVVLLLAALWMEARNRTSSRIDSGYAHSIVLKADDTRDFPNLLMFHARDDQDVFLTVLATSKSHGTSLRIAVDNVDLWPDAQPLPVMAHDLRITDKLRFDVPPAGNVHTVRFTPEALAGQVLIEAIVLVHDGKVE